MPELIEVEIIKRQLEQEIVTGSRITGSVYSELRFSHIVSGLLLTPVVSYLKRRGKFLLVGLGLDADSPTQELIMHMGMTGKLQITAELPAELPKHTHFHFSFTDPLNVTKHLLFIDARKLGRVKLTPKGTYTGLLKDLGPELWEDAYPVSKVLKAFKSIKSILMDQQFIAGIGNYLADEILFDAGIHPRRPGSSLTAEQVQSIITSAKKISENVMKAGGLSFSDYVHLDGTKGSFRKHLKVYGRGGQNCYTCSTELSTITLSGRTTIFCRGCQN